MIMCKIGCVECTNELQTFAQQIIKQSSQHHNKSRCKMANDYLIWFIAFVSACAHYYVQHIYVMTGWMDA